MNNWKKIISALMACLILSAFMPMLIYSTEDIIGLSEMSLKRENDIPDNSETPILTDSGIMIGDIDKDGKQATPKDAMYLARYLAGWGGYVDLIDSNAADADGDSNVTIRDAIILARYIAGFEEYKSYFIYPFGIYSKSVDEEHVREEEFEIDGDEGTYTFIDNEIIVMLEEYATQEELDSLLSYIHGEIVGQIPDLKYYQIEINAGKSGIDLLVLVDEISEYPYIKCATINLVLEYESSSSYLPNDNFGESNKELAWSLLYKTGHLKAARVPQAWELVKNVNKSPSIKMGLIDTGISFHHDLNFIRIYDYVKKSQIQEDYEHGTHVAGIMGAIHNNGGIAGVAIGAKIIGMCSYRDNWFDRAASLAFLILEDCKVINMSLGVNIQRSNYTEDKYKKKCKNIEKAADAAEMLLSCFINGYYNAKKEFIKKEFVIITSAGNDGTCPFEDTHHNNFLTYIQNPLIKNRIIVVGNATYASTEGDGEDVIPASFYRVENSCYRNGRVDVMAPGENIYSTLPDENNIGYGQLSGTSMASPFVAGIAGLIWEANPSLSSEKVKEIIVKTADIEVDDSYAKMVNAELAVSLAVIENNPGDTETPVL